LVKKIKKKSCHGLEPDTMKLIKKINTPLNPLLIEGKQSSPLTNRLIEWVVKNETLFPQIHGINIIYYVPNSINLLCF